MIQNNKYLSYSLYTTILINPTIINENGICINGSKRVNGLGTSYKRRRSRHDMN